VVAVVFFAWAIFTGNFLFALLIALTFFSLLVYALKKPSLIRVAITSRGVKVSRTLYKYENLESFWIFYSPDGIKELSLKSKKMIMPYIKIPLGKANPVKVRRALVKYLPEKRQEESLLDNLSRNLRF